MPDKKKPKPGDKVFIEGYDKRTDKRINEVVTVGADGQAASKNQYTHLTTRENISEKE